jgi:DNA-binding transcriptional ArsR family regulator
VKILNRLLQAGGEAVCVCDFEDMLPLKQPTVSYHLKQLLDAGIIEREKRGSFAYFSVTPGALEHVSSLLGYVTSPSSRRTRAPMSSRIRRTPSRSVSAGSSTSQSS